MDVGGGNKSQGGTCHHETHAKEEQLVELGAGAGELEELWEVTAEVADHTGTTEAECGYGYSVGQCIWEGTSPGHSHQYPLDRLAHVGAVGEGLADGQESVIGHGGQQEEVHTSQLMEEENLWEAGCIGNCALVGQETTQHRGNGDSDAPNVQHWQVSQEEVHGGVEFGLHQDSCQDAEVAPDSDKVGKEEECKDNWSQPWRLHQAQQDELRNSCSIGPRFWLHGSL